MTNTLAHLPEQLVLFLLTYPPLFRHNRNGYGLGIRNDTKVLAAQTRHNLRVFFQIIEIVRQTRRGRLPQWAQHQT